MAVGAQICVFILGGARFAVDIERVREIVRFRSTTAIPYAPPMIVGLLNLRGRVVPALDLRVAFGVAAPDAEEKISIVAELEDELVAFIVDDIVDIVEVPRGSLGSAPRHLEGPAKRLVHGLYTMADGAIVMGFSADAAISMTTEHLDQILEGREAS